jgi:hypothetical protein
LDVAGFVTVTRIHGVKISHIATTETGREALANRPDAAEAGDDAPPMSADRALVLGEMRKLVSTSDDPKLKIAAARVLLAADKGKRPTYKATARDEGDDDATDLDKAVAEVAAEQPAVEATIAALRLAEGTEDCVTTSGISLGSLSPSNPPEDPDALEPAPDAPANAVDNALADAATTRMEAAL